MGIGEAALGNPRVAPPKVTGGQRRRRGDPRLLRSGIRQLKGRMPSIKSDFERRTRNAVLGFLSDLRAGEARPDISIRDFWYDTARSAIYGAVMSDREAARGFRRIQRNLESVSVPDRRGLLQPLIRRVPALILFDWG